MQLTGQRSKSDFNHIFLVRVRLNFVKELPVGVVAPLEGWSVSRGRGVDGPVPYGPLSEWSGPGILIIGAVVLTLPSLPLCPRHVRHLPVPPGAGEVPGE